MKRIAFALMLATTIAALSACIAPMSGAGNDNGADNASDSNDKTGTGMDSVPERFRGEWNTDLAACGTGNNASRLHIGADSIRFYESTGSITSISRSGESEVTLVAELTGEGSSFERTYRFRLSADGSTLTDVNGGMVRQRCP